VFWIDAENSVENTGIF